MVRELGPWPPACAKIPGMATDFLVAGSAGPLAGWTAGDGPGLMLVHGGPGLSDYMSMLAAETTAWRTIGYQQRGIPASVTGGPFTVDQHVCDALDVLDAQAEEPVVLVGHSWGGYLALQIALAAGDRVRGVLVVDGLGSTGDGGSSALGAELRRRLARRDRDRSDEIDARLSGPDATDEDALESLRLLWPGYFADPPTAPALPEGMRLSLACASGSAMSAMEDLGSGSFAERLAAISVPVSVMVADRSPMPVEVGEETARIAGAELTVVEGAGHLPWLEQPGCVATALAGWL